MGIEAPVHDPTDKRCVEHLSGNGGGFCITCKRYDNATWLTQREKFAYSMGFSE